MKACIHCFNDVKDDEEFCCAGCEAAYKIISQSNLSDFYKLRQIDQVKKGNKPEDFAPEDISRFVEKNKNGFYEVSLMIEGLHCAACIWLIENILKKQKNVVSARINLSKKTLFLEVDDAPQKINELVEVVEKLGYKLLPFDAEILEAQEKKYDNSILKALAVAGFGAGNVMLFSFCLWFANPGEIGLETINLMHFFSSLIALPVIIYSSRIFFISAAKSIKIGYPNMDLAISIAIFLASVVSLLETFRSARHVYFDSAVMLVFFLLIGRYLDSAVRKKAFSVATKFAMLSANFGRVEIDGKVKILPAKELKKDMILIVGAGEKIAADAIIIEGESEIDVSVISGESMPKRVRSGDQLFAGYINLSGSIKIKVVSDQNNSLLSQIIKISEEVESRKNHYVRLADSLTKFYLPAVHIIAAATFIFWCFIAKAGWEIALMNATAVLIITCPCALALAVPIVQTITISNFMRRGIVVKSGEALEKIPEINTIVFDKTGSLTLGKQALSDIFKIENNQKIPLSKSEKDFYLKLAASICVKSLHPISKSIVRSYDENLYQLQVQENQGFGLISNFENEIVKIGNKDFCEVKDELEFDENYSLCFMKFAEKKLVFLFSDNLKTDAKQVISKLQAIGKKIILLSGDNEKVVSATAKTLQISEFYFAQTPISKIEFLKKLRAKNEKFIMIGDGLNDAPSLAFADVSISFSDACDISQNACDIVIHLQKLSPIFDLILLSKKSIKLMKQNLFLSIIYNIIAIPFAVAGSVVPLVAALAMSSSSLLVLINSLRMKK